MIFISYVFEMLPHLYPMAKLGPVANMQIDEENNLDTFLMCTGTSEPAKEVVNKELLMFKRFQMVVKDIKCCLEWWAKDCGISCSSILDIVGS